MYWLMLLPSYCGKSYCHSCGRCYCHNDVVDHFYHFQYCVMLTLPWLMLLPNFLLWQILLPSILWLMLLPLFFFFAISLYCKVADVVAIICGRWKTTICLYVMLADVIAMVVDGTTTQGGFLFGRCYSRGGRWNYHWSTLFQF